MIVKPSYCGSFQCIASRCRDNCCIGWEIDIDEETDQFYRNVKGDFGKRLEDGISREGTPHFRLRGEKERCAFLNDDNLCDIFIHLGEEHLCGICREHPRFYEWYEEIPGLPDWTETGLGLCCEEAARLFVSESGPLRLTAEWESGDEREQWEKAVKHPQTEEAAYLTSILSARERAFRILEGSRALKVKENGAHRDFGGDSLADRSARFLRMAGQIQECLDGTEGLGETAGKIRWIAEQSPDSFNTQNAEKSEKNGESGKFELFDGDTENLELQEERTAYFRQLFAALRQLEPMGDFWPELLDELDWSVDKLLSLAALRQEDGTELYERLMEYAVYRYFGKCAFDGDVCSRAGLAVLFAVLTRMMDLNTVRRQGCLSREDQAEHIRLLSKEIEYSEENLEFLQNAFWEEEAFSAERLSEAVKALWGVSAEANHRKR